MGTLSILLLLAACASSGFSERRIERTTAQLQRQADADSLAAAGLLLTQKHSADVLVLLERASAMAPERADLVWLRIQACQRETSCDPRADENRLRLLAPNNGAGWLGEMVRAAKAHDEAAQDAALSSIGRAGKVDVFWTTLVGRLSQAAARTGKMSTAEAVTMVTGIVAAMAIPAYGQVSGSCKGERLKRPGTLEACRGVANAFESGDTVLTEMLGVAMAKRVWPEGSPEWASAVERRRVYDYRVAAIGSLESTTLSPAQARKYLAWYGQWSREQEVMRAQLIDAGEAPDPPPIVGSSDGSS